MLAALLTGAVFGLSIAAPVGPMAMLCISRTLGRGLPAGLAVGLGIATGDAIYGAVAALGLATVTDFLVAQGTVLRVVGAAFLVWLAIGSWRAGAGARAARAAPEAGSLLGSYAVAIGLTLSNPATILSFMAVFAALGAASAQGSALLIVAGVFLGSGAWWLALCTGVSLVRHALPDNAMLMINRLSALLLLGFAVVALLSA